MSVTLLAVAGSLRSASLNRAALTAAQSLAPAGVNIIIYDGMGALPHFNPDLDGETPPAPVQALRAAIGNCDGLLIACPEYAHGVPGSLKNLLDWLVSCTEFPGKPLALINTSARATHAQASLRETLITMSGHIVAEASVTLPLLGAKTDADGILDDPESSRLLRTALGVFAHAITLCKKATG